MTTRQKQIRRGNWITAAIIGLVSICFAVGGVSRITDAWTHNGDGYIPVPDGPQPRPDFRTGDAGTTKPGLVSEREYKRHGYSQGALGLVFAGIGFWLTLTSARYSSS